MNIIKCMGYAIVLGIVTFSNTMAEANRSDYDIDNDRLIEINDLEDLNEIRNGDGRSLYGSSQGCAYGSCIGYELTRDLNFDTNINGQIDSGDAFWNNGEGWEPIGTHYTPHQVILEGNNFRILNLMINRPGVSFQGLFGEIFSSEIRNLTIEGDLSSLITGSNSGTLVGYARSSTIANIHIDLDINGTGVLGGVFGAIGGTQLDSITYEGNVTSSGIMTGGIVGMLLEHSQDLPAGDPSVLENSRAQGTISGTNSVGGIVGGGGGTIRNCRFEGQANGTYSVGGFIGALSGIATNNVVIAEVHNTGNVSGGFSGSSYGLAEGNLVIANTTGVERVGGLTGIAASTFLANRPEPVLRATLRSNFIRGSVQGNDRVGGLYGDSFGGDILIDANVSDVSIESNGTNVGGIAGYYYSDLPVEEGINIWTTDRSGINARYGNEPSASGIGGVLSSQLTCPTAASHSTCAAYTLYEGWDAIVNEDGIRVWNFGNQSQLPGLLQGEEIHRINASGEIVSTSAPNVEPDYSVIATQNYVSSDHFCGWGRNQQNSDRYDLRCGMGSIFVASRYENEDGSCNIDMQHSNYDLINYDSTLCSYTIKQTYFDSMISSQIKVNASRFCNWSTPYGGMGISNSTLRCYMGQDVASIRFFATNTINGTTVPANIAGKTEGCEVNIIDPDYELRYLTNSNGRCYFSIYQNDVNVPAQKEQYNPTPF